MYDVKFRKLVLRMVRSCIHPSRPKVVPFSTSINCTTNETLYDMPYAYKKIEIVFKAGKVLKAAHTHPYTHRVSYTQSHKADGGRVSRNNGFQSPASDAPQYLIGRNGHRPTNQTLEACATRGALTGTMASVQCVGLTRARLATPTGAAPFACCRARVRKSPLRPSRRAMTLDRLHSRLPDALPATWPHALKGWKRSAIPRMPPHGLRTTCPTAFDQLHRL